MGAGVFPNITLTPFTLVEGNAERLSFVPKFSPKTDTIDPGATFRVKAKLAALSTAFTAGPLPTGNPTVLLFTPATVTTTGSTPRGASAGTKK